jgi:hypothetical protein
MNRFLLDTNVISELRKPRPHGGVVAWIHDLQDEQLFLSAVTMGELQAGIERTRRQDPLKAAAIESWADQVASSCRAWDILALGCRNVWSAAGLQEESVQRETVCENVSGLSGEWSPGAR